MDIWHHIAGTDFVWHRDKALANLQKHGIRFEDAATVFLDPLMVLTNASRQDEARDAAIGFDLQARLLSVVHIEFESTARWPRLCHPNHFRPPRRSPRGESLCSMKL